MGISHFFKRKTGDWLVDLTTFLTLDNKYYKKLHNIPIKFKDAHTGKIDHLYISRYGIFVVTIKHKKGYIEGDKGSKFWHVTDKYKCQNFPNALLKNKECIEALGNLLSECKLYTLNCDSYKSVVAFNGECTFSPNFPRSEVTTSLIETIKSYDTVLFDDIQVEVIANSVEKEVMLSGHLST